MRDFIPDLINSLASFTQSCRYARRPKKEKKRNLKKKTCMQNCMKHTFRDYKIADYLQLQHVQEQEILWETVIPPESSQDPIAALTKNASATLALNMGAWLGTAAVFNAHTQISRISLLSNREEGKNNNTAPSATDDPTDVRKKAIQGKWR